MDREELMTILPHRDRDAPGSTVSSAKKMSPHGFFRIPEDAWFLKGHFPGNPIVPGVMLCEILAQSVCVLLQSEMTDDLQPLYTGLNNVRFRRPGATGRPGSRRAAASRRPDAPFSLPKAAASSATSSPSRPSFPSH